jgi:hypothetical protein
LLLERFEERAVPTFNPTNYAAGAAPSSVATADFQNAGGVDFAVANLQAGTVSVFLNHNDGTGTFAPAVNYSVGAFPVDIVAGPLTSGGLPDIIVTNGNSTTATVLFNNPASPGTFLRSVTLQLGANSPRNVRLADLNGDGFLDIITADYGSNQISVLLNNGDGTFAAAHTYSAGTNTRGAYSLAVADFYGDGFPSVAVGNFVAPTNGVISILRGNGDGTLQPFHVIATVPGFTSGLAAGDLGNGTMDLVSANNDTSGVNVLLNDDTGNFTSTNYAINQSFPLGVTLADVDGDGNLDVVTDIFGRTPVDIAILYGNGDGTLQAPQFVTSGGNGPSAVAVADLEGDSGADGFNDLIVPNFGSNNVTVLINTFSPAVLSTTLTGSFNFHLSDGQVVFTEPIDPNTFTPDQFVLLDPNGNQVNVTGITALDGTNTRFDVTFDTQSTLGTYSLTIGPNIFDPTDTYPMTGPFTSTFTITLNAPDDRVTPGVGASGANANLTSVISHPVRHTVPGLTYDVSAQLQVPAVPFGAGAVSASSIAPSSANLNLHGKSVPSAPSAGHVASGVAPASAAPPADRGPEPTQQLALARPRANKAAPWLIDRLFAESDGDGLW